MQPGLASLPGCLVGEVLLPLCTPEQRRALRATCRHMHAAPLRADALVVLNVAELTEERLLRSWWGCRAERVLLWAPTADTDAVLRAVRLLRTAVPNVRRLSVNRAIRATLAAVPDLLPGVSGVGLCTAFPVLGAVPAHMVRPHPLAVACFLGFYSATNIGADVVDDEPVLEACREAALRVPLMPGVRDLTVVLFLDGPAGMDRVADFLDGVVARVPSLRLLCVAVSGRVCPAALLEALPAVGRVSIGTDDTTACDCAARCRRPATTAPVVVRPERIDLENAGGGHLTWPVERIRPERAVASVCVAGPHQGAPPHLPGVSSATVAAGPIGDALSRAPGLRDLTLAAAGSVTAADLARLPGLRRLAVTGSESPPPGLFTPPPARLRRVTLNDFGALRAAFPPSAPHPGRDILVRVADVHHAPLALGDVPPWVGLEQVCVEPSTIEEACLAAERHPLLLHTCRTVVFSDCQLPTAKPTGSAAVGYDVACVARLCRALRCATAVVLLLEDAAASAVVTAAADAMGVRLRELDGGLPASALPGLVRAVDGVVASRRCPWLVVTHPDLFA